MSLNKRTIAYFVDWSLFYTFIEYVLAAIAFGYASVFIGYNLAPSYKKMTALVLCIVLSVVCGESLMCGLFLYGFSWELRKTTLAVIPALASGIVHI